MAQFSKQEKKTETMENEVKKRRRKIIKTVKRPELVRSVKASLAATAAAATTTFIQFNDMWK